MVVGCLVYSSVCGVVVSVQNEVCVPYKSDFSVFQAEGEFSLGPGGGGEEREQGDSGHERWTLWIGPDLG